MRLQKDENGFTYLGLLFAVALMGVALAATGEVWHTAQTREKERELLFVGNQFRQAIGLYYTAGPAKQYPRRLEDLLKDPRQPATCRYLRKIYNDPITGKAEWGLVRAPDGGIVGVHSLSEARPLKVANFSAADQELAGKSQYAQWIFAFKPQAAPAAGVQAQGGAGRPATP